MTTLFYCYFSYILLSFSEKERLQLAGVDPVSGFSSPSSKRRQKSKLNYLLRYCSPAALLATENGQPTANGLDLSSHFNGHHGAVHNLANGGFASVSDGFSHMSFAPASNDLANRSFEEASEDLSKCSYSAVPFHVGAAASDSLSVSHPPPLLAIQPAAVTAYGGGYEAEGAVFEAQRPPLPLIKVKKKHDLYGKNCQEATAYDRPASTHPLASTEWPHCQMEADLKRQSPEAEREEAAAGPSTDMTTNLCPVGRQVKFRIFNWNTAAAGGGDLRPSEEVEPSSQPPLLPRWMPLNRGGPLPVAESPNRKHSAVAASSSSPPPLCSYSAVVKAEPDSGYGAEAAAATPAVESNHHPEIWRQLRLHQLKMEVLDQAASYNNDLYMPPSLTSSGGSGSNSDSGSNISSRSNSCQLLNVEEEEEEDEGGEKQPLDFSLAARGCGSMRNYSVIMSPWKK